MDGRLDGADAQRDEEEEDTAATIRAMNDHRLHHGSDDVASDNHHHHHQQQKQHVSPTFDLRHHAIIPGFVNCHSHAFQRALRGRGETYCSPMMSARTTRGLESSSSPVQQQQQPSFWSWRREMYSLVSRLDSKQVQDLTRQCFEEMRAAGITTVGEVRYGKRGGGVIVGGGVELIVWRGAGGSSRGIVFSLMHAQCCCSCSDR